MSAQPLPENTVERLLEYRRVLLQYQYLQHAYIYSHNLARMARTGAANVRRDLMLLGAQGDVHKGYPIKQLIERIEAALESGWQQNLCFVGMGEPGPAFYENLLEPGCVLTLRAQFYLGSFGHLIPNVPAYDIIQLPEVIAKENIRIGVLAVSRDYAREIATVMVNAGIAGILNFTAVDLQQPEYVVVENLDLSAKLQKIGYLLKSRSAHGIFQ